MFTKIVQLQKYSRLKIKVELTKRFSVTKEVDIIKIVALGEGYYLRTNRRKPSAGYIIDFGIVIARSLSFSL